ncbi:Transposon Ty3-I Gag-Pol polyprotein [Senna tora]|uniref:Transposon Ty3-I Gag-Pol polyprotein n=1 Tax=Senna tora TaxID=362788 RepID=A0A834TMY5_9FABA|nr:Transposon Ty3-I Gag-Pol polyprotein [Senna tora]
MQLKFSFAFDPQADGQTEVTNSSLGKSPFEIVHGFTPCHPIDMKSIPLSTHTSKSTESFVHHNLELHAENK